MQKMCNLMSEPSAISRVTVPVLSTYLGSNGDEQIRAQDNYEGRTDTEIYKVKSTISFTQTSEQERARTGGFSQKK